MMHASFFFIDIVGLSNPQLSTITQSSKIKILNASIAQCKTYETTPDKEKLVFPTGDGMWIAFLSGLEKPIKLAIELHQKLEEFNHNQSKNDNIQVRIGCHSGDVFFVHDLNGTINLWGPGIIMARRVMDAGDSRHILTTSTMAESLVELSDEYREIIHPVHDFKIKHGEVLLVYSVYGDSFGNPDRPQKGLITSKVEKKISGTATSIYYNHLKLIVYLKNPETNLCKISRTFSFQNNSDDPIYEVHDVIQTDSQNSISDLKINAYDVNEAKLEMEGIHLDTGHKKEFSLKLNKPIFRIDQNNEYAISYETESSHNFFEEFYQIDIGELSVEFIFPSNNPNLHPKLYFLNFKQREKSLQDEVNLTRGVTTKITWNPIKNIKNKDLIRIEW
jgi:hypothetical protein